MFYIKSATGSYPVKYNSSKGCSCTRHKDIGGNVGIAPLVLNLKTRLGSVINFTSRPSYTSRKCPQLSTTQAAKLLSSAT